MVVHTSLPVGQLQARTRWGTHASGEVFDRKKSSCLTEQAQRFMAQQALCVVAGLDTEDALGGLLVLGTPGFVEIIDEYTCLLRLDSSLAETRILQRLSQSPHNRRETRLGLFFICHPTRERLCVHGMAELLSDNSLASQTTLRRPISERLRELFFGRTSEVQPPTPAGSSEELVIRIHVRQSFFHCAKYIRTRVPGLTASATHTWDFTGVLSYVVGSSQTYLAEEVRAFIADQLLCFLCTVDQEGQCVVNHRNGHAGFLVTLLPDENAPGGTILLPDYSGNGAFEAIGNIFETGQAALVMPDYVSQLALCISGAACVLELNELPPELQHKCAGAQRVVALSVGRVELQHGDWSATLAYEQTRAERIFAEPHHGQTCPL